MSVLKQALISDVQVLCLIDLLHIVLLLLYATNCVSVMVRTGYPDHCCFHAECVADEHLSSRLVHNSEAVILEPEQHALELLG